MRRVKNELDLFRKKIREYSCQIPNRFLYISGTPKNMVHQYEGYYSSDFLEIQDDSVYFTETIELMSGSPVNIFIRPEISHQEAVRMLKSMTSRFEENPEALMRVSLRAQIEDEQPF